MLRVPRVGWVWALEENFSRIFRFLVFCRLEKECVPGAVTPRPPPTHTKFKFRERDLQEAIHTHGLGVHGEPVSLELS